MTVVEAYYLFRLVGLLYVKKDREDTPHRFSDMAIVTLLSVVLLASIPLLPSVGDGLSRMAAQLTDLPAYRAMILGIAQ
jgi:uncharacterized membrane protein